VDSRSSTRSNQRLHVTEFSGGKQTYGVAIADDGVVYFTDSATPAVGRIDLAGDVTTYALPSDATHVFGIAVGPDSNIWITEWSNPGDPHPDVQKIGRMARDGSSYDSVSVAAYGTPRQITASSDALWFAVGGPLAVGGGLGRLSLDGHLDFYRFPWQTPWVSLEAGGITRDLDNNIWLGLGGTTGYLAKFSPTDSTWTPYPIGPWIPAQLAVGTDGAVWFTDFHHNRLGRLAPDGNTQLFEFSGNPFGITSASNGALWVAEFSGNRLCKIDPSTAERLEIVDLPHTNSQPQMLIGGQSGELWFAEQVGRIGCVSSRHGRDNHHGDVTQIVVPAPPVRLADLTREDRAGQQAAGVGDQAEPPILVTYSDHPSFETPAGPETIWRYIDLAKLVALLDAKALFFARLDTLPDRFEGTLLRQGFEGPALLVGNPQHLPLDQGQLLRLHREALRHFRPRALISCWHLSEVESQAMWELYAPSQNGIAITSTVNRLITSLHHPFVDEDKRLGLPGGPAAAVYVGRVRYRDYDRDRVLPATALDYLTSKRKSFEHEKELRAVILSNTPVIAGQSVQCDVETLVESVRVSTLAPSWFRDVVESILKHYGLDRPVLQSDLGKDPLL
jgi:streptogramin lyase